MNASEIKLVGNTFDSHTDDPKWWDYELEQERIVAQIEKKNAFKLQPIFKKIAEQGVHKIHVPFSGGGDCGGFDGNIIFYDEKNNEIEVNYSKLKADEWRENYIPLIHKIPTKTKGKFTCQIFEYQYTDYKEYDVTEDWLIQRFYEFGFLNEWGSFAGDYHVNGQVIIYPETGKYTMPYNQSVEEYEQFEPTGEMFNETKDNN